MFKFQVFFREISNFFDFFLHTFHESDCNDQLILTDIIFNDIIDHIIHDAESLCDCRNETDLMIELQHERQAWISKCDLFIILLQLNYSVNVHVSFCNEFVRKEKFILLKFFFDIFEADVSVILTVHLLFESNCIAVIIQLIHKNAVSFWFSDK